MPPEHWLAEFRAQVKASLERSHAVGRVRASAEEPRFDRIAGAESGADRRLEARADLERIAAVAEDELSRTLAEVYAALVARVPPTPDALAEYLTKRTGREVSPGAAKVRLHRMREALLRAGAPDL